MRLIVGITGASGANYAIKLLDFLEEKKIETHLIISEWGERVIEEEAGKSVDEIKKRASFVYDNNDMGARISSSSFLCDGMIIVPATVKTVSEIANGYAATLISRAADNMLKMKKKLIVGVRETPLSSAVLKNLYDLSLFGATVLPLSPGFYHKPKSIGELEDFIVGKILDCLEIKNNEYKRWGNGV